MHGTNGGILYWDGERRQPFPAQWEGGYGAQVVVGEEYTLEGLSWAAGDLQDIIVEVSDPVGAGGEEEGIVLTLRTTDGREATCRPHAGESRWISLLMQPAQEVPLLTGYLCGRPPGGVRPGLPWPLRRPAHPNHSPDHPDHLHPATTRHLRLRGRVGLEVP